MQSINSVSSVQKINQQLNSKHIVPLTGNIQSEIDFESIDSSIAPGTIKKNMQENTNDMIIDDSADESSADKNPVTKTLEDSSTANYGKNSNLSRAAHLSRLIAQREQ